MMPQQTLRSSPRAFRLLGLALPAIFSAGCFGLSSPRVIATGGVHSTRDRFYDRGTGWSAGVGLQERDKGMTYGYLIEHVWSGYDTVDITRWEAEVLFGYGPAYVEWGIGRQTSSTHESRLGFVSGAGLVAGWDGDVRYRAALYIESFLWADGDTTSFDVGGEISFELQLGIWF